ncbi:MAG: Radical domain protein [Candidatus Brocadiaceae bacterium]|nr:Radical domain protein [Candidatus Brocadiaceae bacterium]
MINKLILKKESFGGIFIDKKPGRMQILRPDEYENKKDELLKLADKSSNIQVIDVTEMGYPLLTDATSSPNSIFWELTKRCNGTCTDCFMDSNSPKWDKKEVSFAEIADIVRQFVNLGGHSVRLTGGEPTLRADFFDIVDLLSENGIEVGLNTNGMFNEQKLEQILSRGIKDIRISLDGPAEVNDRIRWPGNYKGALRTIESIFDYNKTATNPTKPTINVVLMRSTMPHMEYMIGLARRYGFKLSFGLMRLSGRAKTREMLSPEEVVQAARKVQQMRELLGLKKGAIRINYDIFCDGAPDGKESERSGYAPYPFDNSRCLLGCTGLNLDAYARIAPCGYFVNAEEMNSEDMRGKNLLEVWHNSPLLKMLRGLTRKGCSGCGYYKVTCNGGCPAMAYFVDGDINGKDPYCVKDVTV